MTSGQETERVNAYNPVACTGPIPEHLRDVSCIGAIQVDITFTFTYLPKLISLVFKTPILQ